MATLVLKCGIGALVVLIIALFSKSKSFYIAGLVPLFPTFALIAHYIVGSQRTVTDLRATLLFSMCSIVPYFAYLIAAYFFSYRFSLVYCLLFATIVWIIAAALLLMIWQRYV